MTWSTRAGAGAALRTQMQDDAAPQRYTDAELGIAFDQAVAELSKARPILTTLLATVPANRLLRLDDQIGASLFGAVVYVRDVTTAGQEVMVTGWQYYEQGGAHNVLLPAEMTVGNRVEICVRGGFGFGIVVTMGGANVTVDTNIPAEWRELLIDGAEGYALQLYGKREVGRTNVAPAVAQQTARAAAVILREFKQALDALPFAEPMRQVVTWGLAAVDTRQDAHRGFE